MMEFAISALVFAALFVGFGVLNRGKARGGGGCGCGGSCHHFRGRESELRPLQRKDGVER